MSRRREENLDSFTIKQSPVMLVLSIFLSIIFTVLFYMLNTSWKNDSVTPFVLAGVGLATLLCYFLIYGVIHERVIIEGDNVTVYPLVGKVRFCKISEIDYVDENLNGGMRTLKFFVNGKKMFDAVPTCRNFNFIIERTKDIKRK